MAAQEVREKAIQLQMRFCGIEILDLLMVKGAEEAFWETGSAGSS